MALIFLLGYMGAGKTTLGSAVAAASGARFIDLDQYIEAQARRSVSEIFARQGEAVFRDLETDALRQIAAESAADDSLPVIVACGGGTPCRPVNMQIMNDSGLTVFLEASLPKLVSRLVAERSARPLIASLDDSSLESFIAEALARRMPHYAKAACRFNADSLDSRQQIDESVSRFISRFLKNDNKL